MNAAARPTVSVAVPAYNAERWIGETIESILVQTAPALEVIVTDDGSTDGTARELERFGDRIRVISQENGGPVAAYNRGFEEATGDFVAMCPADDLWEPHKLEWQLETLAAHPDVDISFGHTRTFGTVESEYARPPDTGILDRETLRAALFENNIIATPTALVRRELWLRIGPFDRSLPVEDYPFWMRALREGATFHYDPRLLVRYRRHDSNVSGRLLEMHRFDHAVHLRYRDDVPDRALVRRVLARDQRRIGRRLLDAGQAREARRAYARSLTYQMSGRALAWTIALSVRGVDGMVRRLDARRRDPSAQT
jgi:glycosyltransferase involved in cell wall biosynthesis